MKVINKFVSLLVCTILAVNIKEVKADGMYDTFGDLVDKLYVSEKGYNIGYRDITDDGKGRRTWFAVDSRSDMISNIKSYQELFNNFVQERGDSIVEIGESYLVYGIVFTENETVPNTTLLTLNIPVIRYIQEGEYEDILDIFGQKSLKIRDSLKKVIDDIVNYVKYNGDDEAEKWIDNLKKELNPENEEL